VADNAMNSAIDQRFLGMSSPYSSQEQWIYAGYDDRTDQVEDAAVMDSKYF
jgi:hypothetical protein